MRWRWHEMTRPTVPSVPFPEVAPRGSDPPSGVRGCEATARKDPNAELLGLLRGPLPRPESWARVLRVSAQDAEDLIQDALLALVEKPEAQPRSPRGWLFGAARLGRRRLVRARARAALYEPQIEAYLRDLGGSPPSPDEEIDRRERLLAVFWLLDHVKPTRREVAEHCLFGASSEVLAAELGLPSGTVKSQWRRAKADMRAALDREMARNGDRAWLAALFALVAALWLWAMRRVRTRSGPLLACASLSVLAPAHAALRAESVISMDDEVSSTKLPLPSFALFLPAWAERERDAAGASLRSGRAEGPGRSLRLGRDSQSPAESRLARSAREQGPLTKAREALRRGDLQEAATALRGYEKTHPDPSVDDLHRALRIELAERAQAPR